ncbi:SEC14 domain and spectrin repeat-containing protein 1-B [Cimex lectularius]|uniref:SESTD1-like spectrin repeats region domain-containing protein n=1 Tax=Cimex lectularius TaxID=79782 RepID=A0A8I6SBK2_CIMLE|nr:SEC14 domain and spectrin repeat-containing protein 1-B [Cimex lectularius]XP_014261233.1 SEC14 domain and spectrin repeat-containing protein 1-B [Cimex lectularius]
MNDDIARLVGSLRVPGGRDRQGKPIIQVTTAVDLASFDKTQLEKSVQYILSIFSDETRRKGLTFVVDAQKSNWRLTRLCIRHLLQGLSEETATAIVIRPEAFWDKRVDNCTRVCKTFEPIYIPQSRLVKHIELSQLTEDLGGSLEYDHASWLQDRTKAERFFRENTETQTELERVTKILTGARQGLNNGARTMTQTSATYNNTCYMANSLIQEGRNMLDDFGIARITDVIGQDILDTRAKIDKQLGLARTRLLALHQAWTNLQKSIADAKEITKLESGVKKVTEWLLTKGEDLLSSHNEVGFDIASAEKLRRDHEALELLCRETYGHYAELLHKMNGSTQCGISIPEDLQAQRDFMDFVIRSFATRLERRRNILISSARFFRLVSEYFQTTSDVYENLVMTPDLEELEKAHGTLLQLQESQSNIDMLEDALVREGEKLTDLLAMPVKDALGREIRVDYGADILNIREILDMTKARSELFRDNVELQRITLEQASHIYSYEKDAAQAVVWLDDLFDVMMKSHSQVGCNVLEIQQQKDDQQAFEETAKGTYEFGSQLLRAALSLRHSCKLTDAPNLDLSVKLEESWQRLQTAGHHHMTRLRVTAVLHRSLNKHCQELIEMSRKVDRVKDDVLLKLLERRETVLLEVARMIRLARLLKSRLKEPLCDQQSGLGVDYNRSAVDAISERVAEVIALAEQLDAALCSYHEIGDISDILDTSPTQDDWYGSLDKSSSSSGTPRSGSHKTCCEEDEFITASECTCTPPSRSSSFHTASEGEVYTPPWWSDKFQDESEVADDIESQTQNTSKEEILTPDPTATVKLNQDDKLPTPNEEPTGAKSPATVLEPTNNVQDSAQPVYKGIAKRALTGVF